MSGILDQIDDTLDDWRGSKDSMRWTPEPAAAERHFTMGIAPVGTDPRDTSAFTTVEGISNLRIDLVTSISASAGRFVAAMRQLQDGAVASARSLEALKGALLSLATPGPSALDARYHQRQKNRRKRR